MSFQDLAEFLEDAPIVLRVRGKAYSFPGPDAISADLLLRLHALNAKVDDVRRGKASADDEALSQSEQADLRDAILGDVKQQMVADGLSAGEFKLIQRTLTMAYMYGRPAAEIVWNAAGERPAPSEEPEKASTARGSQGGSTGSRKKPAARHGKTPSDTGT